MKLEVDEARLNREIDALATFSRDEAPAVTRVVFSKEDRAARAWLLGLFAEAGLSVRMDAVGNTFARWTGESPGLAAVGTGSHIDAIPNAGKYDGVVGVLGGLEAMRTLRRSGFLPRRSIELLLFTAEEPTRFGIGCLGSRMLSGTMDAGAARLLRDSDECTIDTLRARGGFDGRLEDVCLAGDAYAAFVELHIEQGPLLEREGIPLGVVTHIAAPASFRIQVEGEGGHAGGQLMPGRHDALCAAAEIVLAVERAALASGEIDTVATVGICTVHPGAVNSIPSRVVLGVDLRDTVEARREGVAQAIRGACDEIAVRRGVRIEWQLTNADPPAQCAPLVLAALEAACHAEGLPCRKMVSRAYHDTLFMARLAPAGMLFIPCRGGVSHRPDEFAEPRAIAHGVRVLAATLALLSQ